MARVCIGLLDRGAAASAGSGGKAQASAPAAACCSVRRRPGRAIMASEALVPARAEQVVSPGRRLEVALVAFVDDHAAGDPAVGQVVDAPEQLDPAGADLLPP